MITITEVEKIHNLLIDRFGGREGIRDMGALESAINRPYQTFEGNPLYPTPADKAAAIFQSIISNHPFMDGNKRVAYVLLRLTLLENGKDIQAEQHDKLEFVISAAKGELDIQEIKDWIINHLV